jgi:thiazole synthase ThiGH ThiG subunit
VEAGRLARQAGRIPRLATARASSPMHGLVQS